MSEPAEAIPCVSSWRCARTPQIAAPLQMLLAFRTAFVDLGATMATPKLSPARPQREWPVHFPPGCPPADAADLSGVIYMLVETNPPTERDMKCASDRGSFRNKPECLRASLSCARDVEHLKEVCANSPRLANHHVASATFQPQHGKIKQTGAPGHHSMWLRAKYLAIGHTMFRVLS